MRECGVFSLYTRKLFLEAKKMKRINKFGFSVIAVAVGLLLGAAILSVALHTERAQAQTPDTGAEARRTDIGVNGTGRVFAQPDTAVVNVGVEITAPTLTSALKQANENMTQVLDAIKGQGVDAKDIQTTTFNVYPITSEPKEGETPQVTAYRVSNVATVKVRQINNVGQVLDAALTAGANFVGSILFTVDDPTKYQEQARTLAVKDAMAKAKTLADAAGVKLGKIVTITELGGGVQPLYRQVFVEAAVPSAAPPIETGQNEIAVTVEMHFEIAE